MNINDVYELMQYAINKAQNGYLSPKQFNIVINQGARSYTSFLLGEFQSYQNGRPISRVQFGQNSVTRQRLTPIIYGYNLSVDVTGFSPYPKDYLQADAMFSIYGSNRIRYVQQDSLYSYVNSVIDPIATNPVYLIEDAGFRFYPVTTASAKLSYVRNPPDMVWGFSNDAQNRPVYDPLKSTQPVFDNVAMYDIIVRALQIVGLNLQLGVVMQYADMIKKGGQ